MTGCAAAQAWRNALSISPGVLDEVLAAVTVRSLGKGHWRSAIDFLSEATARHFRVKLNVVSYSTSL